MGSVMSVGTTKKEIAEKLGVTKQTVTNHIERLGLAEHVSRVGKTDVVDDYAVSVLADSIGKSVAVRPQDIPVQERRDGVIDALNARISDLKDQNKRLESEMADLKSSHEREVSQLQMQLSEANERSAKLADRLADIAERQQAIAAAHWWQRGRMLTNLLGPGKGND